MLLPNDPMDPIADGLGLTVRGPFISDARAVAMQRALWGLAEDLDYQLCVMERVRVPDAIKLLVIIPHRDTPRIRNTYAREETGPYALGFPMKAIEQVDERMIGLGFRRTLPAINRYELQLRDGHPYPINEASYEVVDNTRLVALSRPAYSSLIVENVPEMEHFFTQVLDYERRTSREWSNFSPRFRYVTLHALGARTGNLGLVEYAPADRQPASGVPPRPPNRGLAGWSFPVRSVDVVMKRARLHGAQVHAEPLRHEDPRFGRVLAATVMAPNGFLVEIFERVDA